MAQYSKQFLEQLQLIWGKGFLSPGGSEEVSMIVSGLDLHDRNVLDIGVGLAGPACVLAKDHGARVVGIDVEPRILSSAKQIVLREGLHERISLKLVDPGPLPFEGASFDVVFSKDSLVHIADKPAIYSEIHRVLRPGGWIAVSDWLTGPPDSDGLAEYLAASILDLKEAQSEGLMKLLADLGFEAVSTVDRNDWFAGLCAREQERIAGPLKEKLVAIAGEEEAEAWHARRELIRRAAQSGGLRPTHVRARKSSA